MPSSLSARTTAAPRPVPTATPSSAPKIEITTASTVIMRMVCARRSPIARSRPSSRVRSSTDRARVLMMPSTAITMASASRIWIIVQQRVQLAGLLLDERVPVGHRHLGAVGEQRLHLRLHVGDLAPGASCTKPWIGCGMAKSAAACGGSTTGLVSCELS